MLMGSLVMEEKQLDFNRPLISVRRTSESETNKNNKNMAPPPSPPVYKSDIKSGPVRNPGTVPFQWEHKPGKPKTEKIKPDSSQCLVEPHFVPKLPPGRQTETTKANHHVDDANSYDNDGGDIDDVDTYLDAIDTLSRSESFFFNCSNVSGLSGSGILVEQPFGTLSSDRQTQDLMMGRFLPAAKALTSEALPHLARKPPKPEEPPRQMSKKNVVVVKEKQNKAERNPYRFHHSLDQEEEGDNRSGIMAFGVCGLVPQICFRSSFGVLNPAPSARIQAQRAVSVRRMRSKYQDSTTTTTTPCNETVNEDKRKQKLNGLVAQGPALQVGKEKLETSHAKISKNFGELLASDDNTWNSASSEEAPVAEKTLYVDIVHSVDKNVQQESKEESLLKDAENLIGACEEEEEVISQPKSRTEEKNVEKDEDFIEFSSRKVEECPDQAIVAEVITKEKIDLEEQVQRNTRNLESSKVVQQHRSAYHIVPPPPLPKAPSDSWLKRTLPTIPSKNSSFAWLQSLGSEDNHFTNNNTKIQANPKWETMVKTSNTQQGFVCFSKETLNPIPEA